MLKNSTSSANQIIDHIQHIEKLLECYLQQHCSASPLYESIKYTTLGGGKRTRPFIIYSIGSAISAPLPQLDIAACALELVHSYSLIHDDLPAMDDDDMRRGKLSCHKKFGEATAILTGDAILALAFEIISIPHKDINPSTQLKMINILASASGPCGIASGQERDLKASSNIKEDELNKIHQEKTASLFTAAAALTYHENSCYTLASLKTLGEKIGMAFQLQDDILEATKTAEILGKPTNSDQKNNKPTHHNMKSLEYSNMLLQSYHTQITKMLQQDFAGNENLQQAIELIFSRSN